MTATSQQQQAIAFLNQDPLRNIVPLKMLTAHPADIQAHYAEGVDGAAALLLFPTSAFAYDRATYADLDLVVILSATALDAARQLLKYIPRDRKLIFKLMDPTVQALLAQQWPMQRVTAFVSYTADAVADFAPDAAVVTAAAVDERLLPHFAAQGHDEAEIAHYFATGQARSLTLYQHSEPVAACFTYQNFELIHEIGGVFTLPTERRKGYARRVVQSAVHALLARGCRPRYQVHEANRPSIALAEQIGLKLFVTVEHWRAAGGG
ncbi:MAG: GNAT family N-acetyltransferase [Caldilineaceae bacterium]